MQNLWKPELTGLSVHGKVIQQSQKFLLHGEPQKKYQQLKAPAPNLTPPILKEQAGKEGANLNSDRHRKYAYGCGEKQQKPQKQQLLKQKEERKEVLYRHRTKAKAKMQAKGGACGIPLLAHHLLGIKKASHPGEEPRIKELKK